MSEEVVFREYRCALDFKQSSRIVNQSMQRIGELDNLVSLSLHSCKNFDDSGLASLDGLLKLEYLDLSKTRVTDIGLRALTNLPSLKVLILSDLHITDVGIEHLSKFTNLEKLNLARTRITDKGLEQMIPVEGSTFHKLKEINLMTTEITDEGIIVLSRLRSCVKINLCATKASSQGINLLKKKLQADTTNRIIKSTPYNEIDIIKRNKPNTGPEEDTMLTTPLNPDAIVNWIMQSSETFRKRERFRGSFMNLNTPTSARKPTNDDKVQFQTSTPRRPALSDITNLPTPSDSPRLTHALFATPLSTKSSTKIPRNSKGLSVFDFSDADCAPEATPITTKRDISANQQITNSEAIAVTPLQSEKKSFNVEACSIDCTVKFPGHIKGSSPNKVVDSPAPSLDGSPSFTTPTKRKNVLLDQDILLLDNSPEFSPCKLRKIVSPAISPRTKSTRRINLLRV